MKLACTLLAIAALAAPACAQSTSDPYPVPIRTDNAVRVGYREFATLPDIAGVPARMMLLLQEPGTRNLFVNDMRGPLYRLSPDGRSTTLYVDSDDPRWGHRVQSTGRERGMQSFAFHPQFRMAGTPGYGKFYTWSDVSDTTPVPDFVPGGGNNTHDTVLLEWQAIDPTAERFDGSAPRELLRLEQPYANHNGGMIAFHPFAQPGEPEYGLLYVGVADGGSGGDPLSLAQNMDSPFGKILRIDPLATNGPTGKFGVPPDNPFVAGGARGIRSAIYASGVRNPQRFGWDPANGRLYVADIGQNVVEELSPVPKGGNLGWNAWEASFRYANRSIDTTGRRGDPAMTYPIAEYDHTDPILSSRAAITGVVVLRGASIPVLANRIVFGDNPSGEIFHIAADSLHAEGQAHIRRLLLNHEGEAMTLQQVVRAKNAAQGRAPAARTDLRFGTGPDEQLFLLNKADGVVRVLVGPRGASASAGTPPR